MDWGSLFDSYDATDERSDERDCQYCGEGELHWRMTPDGWRLFDEEGEQHRCLGSPQLQADAHDFPLLSDGE